MRDRDRDRERERERVSEKDVLGWMSFQPPSSCNAMKRVDDMILIQIQLKSGMARFPLFFPLVVSSSFGFPVFLFSLFFPTSRFHHAQGHSRLLLSCLVFL